MRVGVFDSGLGGLTILKSIVSKYPNNEYIYYGDTNNVPYGEKSKEELLSLGHKVIEFLIDKNVDILIMACGTLSSNVYDDIKKEYNIPIIDIISPTVNYLVSQNIKNTLLLATPMTIKSNVFKNKISQIGINVIDVSCPKFVPIIESRVDDNIDYYIDLYLSKYKESNIDVIIPGCTHYPLVKDKIEAYLGKSMIDIGNIIADTLILNSSYHDIKLYFSKIDDNLILNVNKIFPNVNIIEAK